MAWREAEGPGVDGAVGPSSGTGLRVLHGVGLVAAGGIVAACLVSLVAAWLAPEPPVRGWVSTMLVIALFATFPVYLAGRVEGVWAARTSSLVAERVHAPLTGWRRSLDRVAYGTAMVFFALIFVVSFLGIFGVIDDEPADRSTSVTTSVTFAPPHRDGDVAPDRTRERAADDEDGVAIADLSEPQQRTVVAFAASCLLAFNAKAFLSRTRSLG